MGISLPLLHLMPEYDYLKKIHIPLNEIYAVQVIKGIWDKNPTYELNIILENSERIGILNRPRVNKTKEEARELSEFLGVSLWDAVPD